jgi:hypothetical protein
MDRKGFEKLKGHLTTVAVSSVLIGYGILSCQSLFLPCFGGLQGHSDQSSADFQSREDATDEDEDGLHVSFEATK